MSAKLLAAVAMLIGAPAVLYAAPRTVIAEIVDEAPFDAVQLAAAIRLRVPASGSPIRIRVSAAPGALRVETRGSAREVALGGLTGASAARLVALVVDDLLLDDLSTMPAPVAARRTHATVGVLGAAGLWQHALGGLGVDVAVARGAWLMSLDASAGTLIDAPVRMTSATARISGGLRIDLLELRASALIMPVLVSDGVRDQTVLVGVGTSVRLRVPLSDTVRWVLAGGADVFATTTTYLLNGVTIMATPRAAPWVGSGLEIAL